MENDLDKPCIRISGRGHVLTVAQYEDARSTGSFQMWRPAHELRPGRAFCNGVIAPHVIDQVAYDAQMWHLLGLD